MRLGLFFNEGRRRKLSPLWSKIVGVLVVLFAAVELYGAPFGFIDSFILRSVFVSFAITLTFICYTPIRTEPGQSENVPVPDILLACISLAAGAYMVLNGAELVTRWTGGDRPRSPVPCTRKPQKASNGVRPASCSWRPSGRVFRSARVGRPRRPGATLTVFVTGRTD